MLTDAELNAVDDFRFKHRLPSRAAAVRELLNQGLRAGASSLAPRGMRSKDFGVLVAEEGHTRHFEDAGRDAKVAANSRGNGNGNDRAT